MPQIKPTSVQDLLKFIEDHRSEIENGTYDIVIDYTWPTQIPKDITSFLVKHCPGSRYFIAGWSNDTDALKFLYKYGNDVDIHRNLAGNMSTPPEILALLARDTRSEVRGMVAGNRSTPPEVLEMLAKDADVVVRGRVAGGQNTPAVLLEMLSRDDDGVIRTWVAGNPNTPGRVLRILAKDNYQSGQLVGSPVRRIVASNPNTPIEALEILARDPGYEVRNTVASNPNTPAEVLAMLTKKKKCFIATAVYGSENAPEVETLREFRDRYLLENRIGRFMVHIYYYSSPALAKQIRRNELAKRLINMILLKPVIWVIEDSKRNRTSNR